MSAHTNNAVVIPEEVASSARTIGVPEELITEANERYSKAEDSAGRESVLRDFQALTMNQKSRFHGKKFMKMISTVNRFEGFALWTQWLNRVDAGDNQGANELIDACFVGSMIPTSPPTGPAGSTPLYERIRASANKLPDGMKIEADLLRAIAENSTTRAGGRKALGHIASALVNSHGRTDVPAARLIGMHMWKMGLLTMSGEETSAAVVASLDIAIQLMDQVHAAAVVAADGDASQTVEYDGRLVGALMTRAVSRFVIGNLAGGLADSKRAHKVVDGADALGIQALYMCCHIAHALGQMENSRVYFKGAQDLEKIREEGGETSHDNNIAAVKSVCESLMIGMGSHFKEGVNVKVPGRQCANCGKIANKSKGCAGCHGAVYCNKECQKAHWKVHKLSCKAKKAAVEAARQDTTASRWSQVNSGQSK